MTDYTAIHHKVKRLFTYTPDQVQFDRPEDWRSHADAVENDEPFKGDCDDFAMTCAELLVRQDDTDPSNIGIAFCKTETGTPHLVCLYDRWILDNRREWPVEWDSVGYEWISVMYMSEPGKWLAFA